MVIHPTLPFLTTAWVLIPSRENQGDTHGTPTGYPPIHPTTPPLLPLTGPKTGDPQLPNHPHKGRKKGRKRGGKREYKSKFSLGENPQTPPQLMVSTDLPVGRKDKKDEGAR